MGRRLSVVLLLACGCPQDVGFPAKECGIIGGHDEEGLAAVGMVVTPTSLCTGTLVAPRVVVTAQHCFQPDQRPEEVGFVTGRRGEQLEAAGVALFHRGEFVPMQAGDGTPFLFVAAHEDFAVLALDHEPTVEPLPYRPFAVDAAEVGSPVEIVGYGVTVMGGDDVGAKRAGNATLSQVLAGSLETERQAGQASGCHGDSGGPLLLNGEVVGVFSYFVDLDLVCEGGGQYSRLDHFTDLIDQAAAAAASYQGVDDDRCPDSRNGVCDEGRTCYPGADATDCAEVDTPAECACDDECAARGDCCDGCAAAVGACDPGHCEPGDGLCDEDLACCASDPDCGADGDGGGSGSTHDDSAGTHDAGEACEAGLCVPDDGFCDEGRPCCQDDPDCRVDC